MVDPLTLTPPAGWYADPNAAGWQRWWSGTEWTLRVQVAPPVDFAARPYAVATVDARTNATAKMLQPAITSLVFGIISLALNPFLLASIVAWARGGQALKRARRWQLDGYAPHGKVLALWGIWLAVAGIGNGALLSWVVITAWTEYLF